MMPLQHNLSLNQQERSILRTLLYFDIFQYPLSESEILRFSPTALNADWTASLASLCDQKIVFHIEEFYCLNQNSLLAARRMEGNLLAGKKLITARKFVYWMSLLPFVRSIMLSGSISKGYMDPNSDIDYFIITSAGRLWIVRTAMALFRRVFLFNSHKYFCTNYFIDEANTEITEKNIFTAVETTTLKPMFGKSLIHQFQLSNQWCLQFLPNCHTQNDPSEDPKNFLKRLGEKMLPSSWWDALDVWLMKKSIAYWESRYHPLLDDHDFSIAFQSTRQVSRSHPEFYQKKVLLQYEEKINAFEIQHGVSLQV